MTKQETSRKATHKGINKQELKGEQKIKEVIQAQSAGQVVLQNEMIRKRLDRGEHVRIITPDERVVLKEFREHPNVEVLVSNGIIFGGVTHS